MLNILRIHNTNDFFQYFIEHSSSQATVVCPNPAIADLVRSRFSALGQEIESITISKFIRDQLMLLEIEDLAEKYRGKSELMVILAGIWAKLGEDKDYTQFKKSFNLFTEIRSFSLSEQVLESVLENYDERLAQSVLWIYRFVAQLDIIDEHRSYFVFSEKLRDSHLPVDYPQNREIVFYGFEFLTGSQVDLIRSLSLRDKIYIPIYSDVYNQATMIDWPKWFDEHNTHIIDIPHDEKKISNLKITHFPKGYLNKYLRQSDLSQKSIVLGSKDINSNHLQEIPGDRLKFKVKVDIFESEFLACMQAVEKLLDNSVKSVDDIKNFIFSEMNLCITNQDFLKLKSYLLYLNKLNYWTELSSENNYLSTFEFQIIKEATMLDLPRLNLASLGEQFSNRVFSLKQLEEIQNESVSMIFSSGYPNLKPSSARYTENVELYLGAIGPLRGGEFELLTLKSKLKEFLENNEVDFFIEEGLLEHDLGLNHILSDFEKVYLSKEIDFSHKHSFSKRSEVEYDLKSLSASKLQRYLDCPQKFYYDYVVSLTPRLEFKTELSILDLGAIQHEVIEDYFKRVSQTDFSATSHYELVQIKILKQLGDRKIDASQFETYRIEVLNFTRPAIQFLLNLKNVMHLDFSFEYPFQYLKDGITYRGSVDCLAISEKEAFIIDFKRSNASFRSYKMIEEYEQVQLWFYLTRLNETQIIKNREVTIGYLDLSDLDNSTFFTDSSDKEELFKSTLGVSKIKKINSIEECLESYAKIESDKIAKIQNDRVFAPKPATSSVCMFCSVNKICSKGENHAIS